jgi:hypothetical protein
VSVAIIGYCLLLKCLRRCWFTPCSYQQKQQQELEKEMEALQMSTDPSKMEMIPTSPSQNSRYNI